MTRFSGSLDTNVLARLLLADEPKAHRAALRLIESQTGQLAIADTAMIELAFVLERHYRLDRPSIREAFEGVMATPAFNCNRTLFLQALQLFVQHQALSLEDCCLSIYAALNGAEPLWTFDKKLASQANNAQLVRM